MYWLVVNVNNFWHYHLLISVYEFYYLFRQIKCILFNERGLLQTHVESACWIKYSLVTVLGIWFAHVPFTTCASAESIDANIYSINMSVGIIISIATILAMGGSVLKFYFLSFMFSKLCSCFMHTTLFSCLAMLWFFVTPSPVPGALTRHTLAALSEKLIVESVKLSFFGFCFVWMMRSEMNENEKAGDYK